jgi:hypothetical protein
MREELMIDEYHRQWTLIEIFNRNPWPASVRRLIGSVGEFLLDACLAIDPCERPSASQAANHVCLHPKRLVLGGTVDGDSLGERGFVPLVTPRSFPGTRHDWNMVAGNVGVETLEWLRGDVYNQDFEVDFNIGEPDGDKRSEHGCKYILAGKMVDEPSSLTMMAMSIAKHLPLPRLRAFFAAFKAVNSEVLFELNSQARAVATSLPAEGEDKNKIHFLQHTLDSWFLSCGEFTMSEADGSWAEPVHLDGGASVVHCGITLFGDRRLVCERPGDTGVVMHNTPGSFYIGGFTGPTHGVTHLPSAKDQLLEGKYSTTVMLRTTLFPFARSRIRNTTPAPQGFFFAISASMVDCFARLSWKLPSLEACTAEFDRAAAAEPAEPKPRVKAAASEATGPAKPKAAAAVSVEPKAKGKAKAKQTAAEDVTVAQRPAKRARE